MEPKCPRCAKVVAEWEIKEIMKAEDWAEIESKRLDITVAQNPKLIKC